MDKIDGRSFINFIDIENQHIASAVNLNNNIDTIMRTRQQCDYSKCSKGSKV
jgi:hypothetical protein